jgi:hypothetical protein
MKPEERVVTIEALRLYIRDQYRIADAEGSFGNAEQAAICQLNATHAQAAIRKLEAGQ